MARPPSNTPTDSELEILRILWEKGPSTVRQVYDQVQRERSLAYTTILTQLQVMHDKGLVLRDESQRQHVYRATRPQAKVERGVVRSIISRTFGGMARNLVMHALSLKKAPQEEMERINKLFDELEGRKND